MLLGLGDGTFELPQSYTVGDGVRTVTTGDFDRDGVTDLATANQFDESVSVLLGTGDGTFAPQQTFDAENSPTSIATADFNGDGNADLVFTAFFLARAFARFWRRITREISRSNSGAMI